MPDQAEGLRDLANSLGPRVFVVPDVDQTNDGHQTLPRVGRLGKGFAEIREKYGPEFDRAYPDPRSSVDKARLWDDMKSDLEREAIGPAESQSMRFKTIGGFGPRRAQAVLDRMNQAETLAQFVHVPAATPATFDRVRDEMRGES